MKHKFSEENEEKDFFTLSDVASILNVPIQSVLNYINEGLPYLKFGNEIYFVKENVYEWATFDKHSKDSSEQKKTTARGDDGDRPL